MTPEHPLPEEVEKAIERVCAAHRQVGRWEASFVSSDGDLSDFTPIADEGGESITALRSAISTALAAKAGEE
jgi:hypothetical protein